jgi:phosphoglycolate phosphatase-like HAD superfamily hydrolase
MTRTFADIFGVRDAFTGVAVAGYTDSNILSRALLRAGLPNTPDVHARFRHAYVARLRHEIADTGTGAYGLLPGVRDLLEALARDERFHLGLLTGNYQAAAEIKLRTFGVDHYFEWGAFGEDSTDRNELACLALARARERRVPHAAFTRAVVIGDTPHDIACARAAGARAIAVATGPVPAQDLADAGADAVLDDLSDTARVLRLL